ncbi:unnamed protein product, partial [marine sediment metagenome]
EAEVSDDPPPPEPQSPPALEGKMLSGVFPDSISETLIGSP